MNYESMKSIHTKNECSYLPYIVINISPNIRFNVSGNTNFIHRIFRIIIKRRSNKLMNEKKKKMKISM